MRQFLIAAMSAAALSACSEGRERRALSIDTTLDQPDLTLPDTVTRKDTSVAVAARSEPPKPAPPARRRSRPAAPKAPATDTAVQAYAPGQPQDSVQTSEPRVKIDSTPMASDTVATAPDTGDRVRAATSTPDTAVKSAADTITTSPMETATPPVVTTSPSRDTATPRPATDTLTSAAATRAPRSADTTSTPPADTMVARPPAAPAQPARPAVDLAARTLPVGTEIHAQLDDSITSRRDTAGQIVAAHVMENVRGPNGRTLIPAGAQVRFSITRIRPSRSKNSQGTLRLRVDSIALGGKVASVQAETRAVPRELRGRGVTAGDAAKVGGGAAAGAVIGGVVGKTRGAVIGGVAGAAAGAIVASQTKTRDVVVKAKTPVVFVLTAPLVAP
jgi:hypothetical protein